MQPTDVKFPRKKSLLLAASLICAAPFAHADGSVTLYGLLDAGLQYINNVGVAARTATAGHPSPYVNKSELAFKSGGQFSDRWGMKGREDIGGGMAVVFTLENGFNGGTGALSSSNIMFNRQAFVGVTTQQYGNLTLGRQYEAITDLVEMLGPISFTSGVSTYPGDISNYDNNVRVDNAIKYVSPNFHGLSGEVLFGFGNAAGHMNQDSTFSAGIGYNTNNLGLGVGYLRMDNSNSTANAWSGTGSSLFSSSINAGFAGARIVQIVDAAGRYTLGALALGLSYGFVQYRPSDVSLFKQIMEFNMVGVGALYTITPTWQAGISGNYTRGQAVNAHPSRPDYEQVSLSNYYSLSKRTQLYAIGSYQHAKGQTLDSVGDIVNATASVGDSADGASSGAGNQILIRIGMTHRF